MNVRSPPYDRAAVPLQHEREIATFIDRLVSCGARSYLEIGARYGGSFERVMMALPPGSRGVCVDFPGGEFGDDKSTGRLLEVLACLRRAGRDVHAIFGPSGAPEVVERVRRFGRFDAVFIDGDHRYAAVKRDFELYSPLGRMVALHDIAAPDYVCSRAGTPVEVPRLWAELKDRHTSIEILDDNTLMGIGVVFFDDIKERQ